MERESYILNYNILEIFIQGDFLFSVAWVVRDEWWQYGAPRKDGENFNGERYFVCCVCNVLSQDTDACVFVGTNNLNSNWAFCIICVFNCGLNRSEYWNWSSMISVVKELKDKLGKIIDQNKTNRKTKIFFMITSLKCACIKYYYRLSKKIFQKMEIIY